VPAPVRRRPGRRAPGGILTYAADRIYTEVAYVAYHFHWSMEEILDLEHAERLRYVAEIAKINTRISEGR
jgi:hypothetical protein